MNEDQVYNILTRIPWAGHIGRSGDWHFSVRCLVAHKHEKGYDNHPSMTISFNVRHPWTECFTCGHRKSLEQTLNMLVVENKLDPTVAYDYSAARLAQLSLDPIVPMGTANVDYSIPLDHLLKNDFTTNASLFLDSKGVSMATAAMFKLAYVPEGHSDEWMGEDRQGNPKVTEQEGILLPVFSKTDDEYRCCGGQLRLMAGDFRYYALYKFSGSVRFFGEQFIDQYANQDVFLVEGGFDAMHLVQEGFPALAMMGTVLSEDKASILKLASVRKVNLLLDPDVAGQKAVPKIQTILTKYGIPFSSLKANKDPKEYTNSELNALLKNRLQI